jgi:hypothetical protein
VVAWFSVRLVDFAQLLAGMLFLLPNWLDASRTKTRWVLAISATVLSVVAIIGVVSNAQRRAAPAHSQTSSQQPHSMSGHMQ